MATDPTTADGLNLREQIARIDQLQADAARKKQETQLAPWQLVMTGLGAGGALFAAGAAFMKIVAG